MNIACTYYVNGSFGYTCVAENQTIPVDTKLKFIGEHKNGRTNNDVQLISFNSCIISKVPQELTKIFPNLDGLEIYKSGLKDINRSDFLEYKHFKWLYFSANQIEYLPGDLFADCKKLEGILFGGNPLSLVDPIILDGLEHLKLVSMNGLVGNYGKIVSESTIALDDPKLVAMKLKLYEEHMKTVNSKNEKLLKVVEKLTKFKTFFQTDEVLKDFYINIGDKQFNVHKGLLVIRSPTLAETLRNNPQAENLNLNDISVNIFEAILKFLYTDELPKEIDFMQLFVASERLKIDELKDYAAEKILEQLDFESAPEVLNLGNKYRHDGMKRKAFEKIKRKYPEIKFKEEWLNKGEKIEKMIENFQKMRDLEQDLVESMECEED